LIALWLLVWLAAIVQLGGLRTAKRTFLSLSHAHLEIPAIDLYQDWAAGRDHVLGDSIYAPLTKNYDQHRPHLGLPDPPAEPILTRNAHPPMMTLLVLGLAHFEYRTAFVIWSGLGILLLLVSIHLVLSGLWPSATAGRRLLVTVCLGLVLTSAYPVSRQFQFGNVQMVLLGLVTGAWFADRRGHRWLAGLLIGLAAGVKLYPGFLVLYFLALRSWRGVSGAILAFVILVLSAGLVFGFDVFPAFVTEAMPAIADYRSDPPNLSLFGLASKLFNPGTHIETAPLLSAPWLAVALAGLSFLLVTVLFLRAAESVRKRPDVVDTDMLFGLGIVAMLLLSPATWPHSQCLLLVPIAVLLARARPNRPAFHVVAAIVLVIWLSWPAIIGWRFHPDGEDTTYQVWESLTWTSLGLYAMLGLFVLGLRALAAPQARPRAEVARE